MITTVEEILSVELISQKGLAVRFLTKDGTEYLIQLPHREAYALADMVAIALSRLQVSSDSAND